MNQDKVASETPLCPVRDDLAAFVLGRLLLEELEFIAEHLSRCQQCESSLQALQVEDTIVTHLRRNLECVGLLEEPQCLQLEDRARAIPLGKRETPTASDDTPDGGSACLEERPPLPAVFGAYVLLEQLGQGGMGIVYKARQEAIRRLVAVKMVRTGRWAGVEERVRFRREGEAIARVHHANIVQIHEYSEHDGQLYFSMELLEGGSLAHRLKHQPLPEREAAELVRTLARAVHAAHQCGIIHRDLKPGNVLFAVDGTPKITDFGLAKLLDGEDNQTRSNMILGTPTYMAPEQARGESQKIGPAADVYALGAILYESLAGRPPFLGKSNFQTMELVRTHEPDAPSRRRSGLSRDLEAICLKCLEKRPDQRYTSAENLADDLDRWLKGEPTLVRPLNPGARVWRTFRRHPFGITAASLAAVLLALSCLAGIYFNPERRIERIEKHLARGDRVTLIAKKGEPAWYRWSTGREMTQTSLASDGAFSLHSWTLALVELVRDPQRDSYRIRAEVRHEEGKEPGQVGLYFAHRCFQAGPDLVHYFGYLAFDDINDVRDLYVRAYSALPDIPKPPPPKGNPVFLMPYLYAAGEQNRDWEHGIFTPRPEVFFFPAGGGGGPWHSLVVEVRPDGVNGFWDDKAVGRLTATEWVGKTNDRLANLCKDDPKDPRPQAVKPEWMTRGGAGLFLFRGSASFRNLVIEPLRPSD
jgi:eukaryotic-like serine/threonine-protein kinase